MDSTAYIRKGIIKKAEHYIDDFDENLINH